MRELAVRRRSSSSSFASPPSPACPACPAEGGELSDADMDKGVPCDPWAELQNEVCRDFLEEGIEGDPFGYDCGSPHAAYADPSTGAGRRRACTCRPTAALHAGSLSIWQRTPLAGIQFDVFAHTTSARSRESATTEHSLTAPYKGARSAAGAPVPILHAPVPILHVVGCRVAPNRRRRPRQPRTYHRQRTALQ